MSVRAVGGAGRNLYVAREGTRSVPPCAPACPPHGEWPAKNLIIGTCPGCGMYEGMDGRRAARALRARRLAGG